LDVFEIADMTNKGLIGQLTLMMGLALSLTACMTGRGGSISYNTANFGPPDAPAAVSPDAVYKLAPSDVVTVTVFGVPDLSGDYTVDQSGGLTMPLLGRVGAIGNTPSELADEIKVGLSQKYLHDPNVTVAIKDATSRVITVDGSVKDPGVFAVNSTSLTLLQAVALAKGPDDLANPHRVAIFRTIHGEQVAGAFDLVSIRRGEAENPRVYAGDTIIVDGSGLKKAQRGLLQSLPIASLLLFRL
jgi:polysaccharide export outer membrane protein